MEKNDSVLPEWICKGYVNAEVTLCLVCTVHAETQSSRIATTCCKCKDCKKLWKNNGHVSLPISICKYLQSKSYYNHCCLEEGNGW